VEAVEDDGRVRQVLSHRSLVGRPHIHGHRFDAGGGCLRKLGQEQAQAVRGFAVADPQQAATFQVIDHGDVVVALGASHFVHTQVAQAGQIARLQRRQRGLQVPPIHVLHRRPGQACPACHRRDRQMPAHRADQLFQAFGVAAADLHERQLLHPPVARTDGDFQVLDVQCHPVTK